MLKLIMSIMFVLAFYSHASSQPIISGYSGTIADGNSIIISATGNSFGSTGPNIQLYDNMELGTNGARISDGSGDAAVIGTWDWVGSDYNVSYPSYSTNEAVSGTKSFRSNHSEAYDCGTDGTSANVVLTKSTDFYFSYWMKIPTGQVIPGTTSCGPSPNLKVWWLSSDNGYGSDYGLQILSNSNPSDAVALGPIDGGEYRCAGSYGSGSCAGEGYVSAPFYRGRWMRMEFYIHGATDNTGAVYGWLMDSDRSRYAWQSYPTGDNTLDSGDSAGWGYLHFHGYARKDSNSNTYLDDIYVATGSGARARVEIGNASTFANCTNLSVCTVTSWSASSIQATVRTGSFSNGTAYLFVVDSDGNVSSGYEVTVGSGSTPSLTISGVTGLGVSVQ